MMTLNRLRWRWRRVVRRIALSRGWIASAYDPVFYWPMIYGVTIAWWDVTLFNRDLAVSMAASRAALAEWAEALGRLTDTYSCHKEEDE